MANIYTDESRLARYSVMIKRRNRYERIFGVCMWAMIICAGTEIIPHLFNGLLYGLFIGELQAFFVMLGVAAFFAFAIYALVKRSFWFILPAFVLCLTIMDGGMFYLFGNFVAPLSLIVSGIVSLLWAKLSQEEGFPRFEISYAEEQGRKKVQERRSEYRAQQAGIRTEQEQLDVNAEMTDLLDADSEVVRMPAKLNNYHERYRNADAVVRAAEAHDGTMTELAEQPDPEEMLEL